MTRRVIIIITAVLLAICSPRTLSASGHGDSGEFSPKEMVMEHLTDSYE